MSVLVTSVVICPEENESGVDEALLVRNLFVGRTVVSPDSPGLLPFWVVHARVLRLRC